MKVTIDVQGVLPADNDITTVRTNTVKSAMKKQVQRNGRAYRAACRRNIRAMERLSLDGDAARPLPAALSARRGSLLVDQDGKGTVRRSARLNVGASPPKTVLPARKPKNGAAADADAQEVVIRIRARLPTAETSSDSGSDDDSIDPDTSDCDSGSDTSTATIVDNSSSSDSGSATPTNSAASWVDGQYGNIGQSPILPPAPARPTKPAYQVTKEVKQMMGIFNGAMQMGNGWHQRACFEQLFVTGVCVCVEDEAGKAL